MDLITAATASPAVASLQEANSGESADRWCLTSVKCGSEAVPMDMALDTRPLFQAISGIRSGVNLVRHEQCRPVHKLYLMLRALVVDE